MIASENRDVRRNGDIPPYLHAGREGAGKKTRPIAVGPDLYAMVNGK
jgi:hypothetical protein